MSISDLNHFMTYVIEGWMLFSAGFIGVTFVSFVSRRIQEDIEAAALAEGVSEEVAVKALAAATTEAVAIDAQAVESQEVALQEATPTAEAASPVPKASPLPKPAKSPKSEPSESASGRDGDEPFADEVSTEEEEEAARLEEVAAVSEQLAKNRGKQSDSSSVSVST